MLLSSGKPANDIEVTGIQVRWPLNRQWSIQAAAQSLVFDFERPAAQLGVQQDPGVKAVDAKAKSTLVSLGLRSDHPWAGSNWGWFWSVDLGTGSVKVPTVSGPVAGGGTFNVSTSAKREWVLGAGSGVRWQFHRHAAAELGLQLNHHQANWTVTDSVSGRSGKIGAYQAYGLWVGVLGQF